MSPYTFALILIVIFVGLEFYRDLKYWKRIDRLLNRIQSPDYEKFRYFEDQYRRDLKSAEEQIRELRKKENEEENPSEAFLTPEDKKAPSTSLKLEDLEEDWSHSEFGLDEKERIE